MHNVSVDYMVIYDLGGAFRRHFHIGDLFFAGRKHFDDGFVLAYAYTARLPDCYVPDLPPGDFLGESGQHGARAGGYTASGHAHYYPRFILVVPAYFRLAL
jgi:hypothetical protein